MINPDAGDVIAFLCVVVNRGGSRPLVVDVTSNAAVLFTAPVTPIPICAFKWIEAMVKKQAVMAFR